MNDKQTRMLTWLAGILIALVAVIALLKPPEEEAGGAEGREEEWSDPLPDVTSTDITGLQVQAADGPAATFVREAEGGAGWSMTAPAAAAADTPKLEALARAVADLECGSDLGSSDPAAFGLSPPRWLVTATTAAGKTLKVAVGSDAPVGWRTYVQCGDDPTVRTSRARLSESLEGDPAAWRSRDAIQVQRDTVTKITLSRPDQPALSLRRDAGGWWVDPPGARADASVVSRFLRDLDALEASAFDVPAPQPPLAEIRLEAEGRPGEGEPQVLSIGAGGAARVPLQAAPVTLSGDPFAGLPADAAGWLSPELLAVEPADLTEITVRLGEERLSATRGADGWSQPAAESTLGALQAARVDRAAAVPAPEGEPWGEIRLTSAKGAASARVHQAVPGGRVAVEEAGGPPFLLPDTEIRRLQDGLAGKGPPPADPHADEGMPPGLPEGITPEMLQQMMQGGG